MEQEIDRRIGASCHSNEDAGLVHCGEERAELRNEALDLPVGLRSYPHLWAWVMTERMRSRIQGAEMSFLSSAILEELRVELLDSRLTQTPPHWEESVQVNQASVLDASGTHLLEGAPGTSYREEAQGMAQDTLEGLCVSAGLKLPPEEPE
ncbi:hypothetical protein ATANTOWER_008376 [Ataeniobius toweri]|uniref:Uncharacterized protein n=1 Tax=Ataeniobius toweri TaxID=208326 RepID=A0ABU7BNG0_9TELE|nr:hypothetical protein [Ataeniobius toweri]